MILPLFAVGLLSLLGQVVILRELHVTFYGVELIYLLALGIWLAWTAAGALFGRARPSPSPARLAFLFATLGLVLLLEPALLRAGRLLLGGVRGAYLPISRQFLLAAVSLAAPAALLGMLFREAAGRAIVTGRSLAFAYGLESAGSATGGLLATLMLAAGIPNFSAAITCSAVAALTAIWTAVCPAGADDGTGSGDTADRGNLAGLPGGGLPRDARRKGKRANLRPAVLAAASPSRTGLHCALGWLLAAVVVLFTTVLLWWARSLDAAMTAWNHPGLLFTADTPYGRITSTGRGGQLSVFVDDALVFSTEGAPPEELAHLTALQHPAPRAVLLLGGSGEGLIRRLRQHHPARIDVVELNVAMPRLLLPYLPAAEQSALLSADVRLIHDDPRRFLNACGSYDLIVVAMPEPASGQANRFYTREFFALCAAHLRPGGILGLRLPGDENFWSIPLATRVASIAAALRAVFPDVLFLPGPTAVITASRAPLPSGPQVMVARWHERGLQADLVTPPYIAWLFTNDRFPALQAISRLPAVPPNTDSRPICYRSTMILWLAHFFPRLAFIGHFAGGAAGEPLPSLPAMLPGWEQSCVSIGNNAGVAAQQRVATVGGAGQRVSTSPAYGMAGMRTVVLGMVATALGIILLFTARRRQPLRRALFITAAAFAGMVAESVLILAYQVKQGVLFRDVGLLLTSFMVGMAVGPFLIERLTRSRGVQRAWGVLPPVGFVLLGSVLAGAPGSSWTGMGTTAVLLAAAGLLVGAAFALAGAAATGRGTAEERQQAAGARVAAILYAADLIGGCLGAVTAGLLFVPFVGLNVTGGAVAAAGLLCLLLA